MSATAMGADAQQREAGLRTRYAAIAVVAGVLLMVAAIIQMTGPHTSVNETTLDLIYANKRAGLDIVAAIVSLLGSVAIALTLVFLFDAARARNPTTSAFIRWLAIGGAALAAISAVAYAIAISQKAHDFVTTGAQTYQEAHRLTTSGGLIALQLVGLLGALLVAFSIVLVSLQAMRVGLLTRFMGYLGMFAGALVLFQITPVPVVETYWFIALAVLFLGRWPTGEPMAWRTGRAEPWPSGQAAREQRVRAAGAAQPKPRPSRAERAARAEMAKAQADRTKPANGSATASDGDAVTTAAPAGASGRSSQKRKRKRKR
jgi:hypothetical protein